MIVSWSVWPAVREPPAASVIVKVVAEAALTVMALVVSERLPTGRLLSVAVTVFVPPLVASVTLKVCAPLSGEPPLVVNV